MMDQQASTPATGHAHRRRAGDASQPRPWSRRVAPFILPGYPPIDERMFARCLPPHIEHQPQAPG